MFNLGALIPFMPVGMQAAMYGAQAAPNIWNALHYQQAVPMQQPGYRIYDPPPPDPAVRLPFGMSVHPFSVLGPRHVGMDRMDVYPQYGPLKYNGSSPPNWGNDFMQQAMVRGNWSPLFNDISNLSPASPLNAYANARYVSNGNPGAVNYGPLQAQVNSGINVGPFKLFDTNYTQTFPSRQYNGQGPMPGPQNELSNKPQPSPTPQPWGGAAT